MLTKVENLFAVGNQQALLRLLQLTSPTLPIGSYAYSQGLESVIETKWVTDAASLETWLAGIMRGSLRHVDIPIMKRLYQSCLNNDAVMTRHWDAMLLAYRETAELRKEELDKGHAITELLKGLQIEQACLTPVDEQVSFTFLTGYSCAAVAWHISLEQAAQGYVWGWLENQVVAAMKLMPLGQIASQKILSHLIAGIPELVNDGLHLPDEDIGSLLPAQAIASATHETQYSRLFRS